MFFGCGRDTHFHAKSMLGNSKGSLQLSISGGMSLTSMSNPQTTHALVATANASSAERTPSAKPRIMARMTWKQYDYEQNRLYHKK